MSSTLNLNFLIADNDPVDALVLQQAFNQLSWCRPIAVLLDGQQVLDYLQGQRQYSDRAKWPLADFLVLDHRMPRLSGIDVLSFLRSEPDFRGMPAVLLSAAPPPELKRALTQLQASYCEKSADVEVMAKALRIAVSKALCMSRRASQRVFEGARESLHRKSGSDICTVTSGAPELV